MKTNARLPACPLIQVPKKRPIHFEVSYSLAQPNSRHPYKFRIQSPQVRRLAAFISNTFPLPTWALLNYLGIYHGLLYTKMLTDSQPSPCTSSRLHIQKTHHDFHLDMSVVLGPNFQHPKLYGCCKTSRKVTQQHQKYKNFKRPLYLTITIVDTVTPTNWTKLLQPECFACPRTTTRSPTPRRLTHLTQQHQKYKNSKRPLYLTITIVDTVTPTNWTKLLQPECFACPRTTTRSPTPRRLTHLASSSSAESDDHVT